MERNDEYLEENEGYDVALSFAGEQRDYVREVAKILAEEYELKVFFDEFEEEKLWGKNLYDKLHEIYSKKARYIIIFVSKEYKEKIWTNHERKAAQERALELKDKEYILPVRFDESEIPGLPSTVCYLDARKFSPQEVALTFAKKLGLKTKPRWFGKWEREKVSKAVIGILNIYEVDKKGFYYDIDVIHGSYTGDLEARYAEFINNFEAKSKVSEECLIKFTMLNNNLHVQEEGECPHGIRAYFDGKYILQKDFFYHFKRISDENLSKLYRILGKEFFEEFEMCFSDYREKSENNKYILYGSVPGFFPVANGCLIIEDDDVRGFFVNCNVEENVIFWFASDNKLDEEILKFKSERSQFNDFVLKRIYKENIIY
ncbi:TIR domain-containing protein [Kosmotoga sp.]|uniref:toll/interleukin-1 receptor domain-containing protein n=1 Tax=Kosmotoga sp. TaxID=1955248 RepID=UPI0024AB0EA7|nr:TIR domain-containing protein [Kosmotoga sp.]MDI3524643.1 hypothetical protein [Kosmotoga sp.]MDK2836796.1 hypothetical protein [Thermosediminibacterales bacterium]